MALKLIEMNFIEVQFYEVFFYFVTQQCVLFCEFECDGIREVYCVTMRCFVYLCVCTVRWMLVWFSCDPP